MNFFCQSMHCFDTYWRKIKPRYFFKHIYSHLTFSGNENAFKLYYREGYDYDLFYVFSRRFTPKNLKKIKYANQQLRDIAKERDIVIQLENISRPFDIQLMNMLFQGVRISLDHIYDVNCIPQSAQYNKLSLDRRELQKNNVITYIEYLVNLGLAELHLSNCDVAQQVLEYLEDIEKTVIIDDYITIKLHQ